MLPALPAAAQQQAWLQIEAHSTSAAAGAAAAPYLSEFGAVTGFRLASGWVALALGPFPDRPAAEAERRALLAARRIPGDAFVVEADRYGAPLWIAGTPVAAGTLTIALPEPEPGEVGPAPDPAAAAPEPEPEETLAQAQRAEAALDRDARVAIQTALQWFGHYDLGIDGAFGRGTRNAMAAWQAAEGLEPTGVLTTRQRAALIDGWQAELAGFGFARWRDEAAGIEITLPLALVELDRTEAPFVHFRARDDSGVQVLLISQQGTPATLFGLYEIMQTLEIVPLEGFRERTRTAFTLTGADDDLRSHSFAGYSNGAVKGFTLIWTPDQDARMNRVIEAMRASFRPFGPALPDAIGQTAAATGGAALLSGLELRRPTHARSGFYIDADGKVLTSATLADECRRLTIDERHSARIRARDDALGLLVLEPEDPLAPRAFANFAAQPPVPPSEVVLAGFSFEDILTRPVLTFGQIAALTGLNGEAGLRRLTMTAEPGDIGGPVLDRAGNVIGMLLPRPAPDGRLLPEEVTVAAGATEIVASLRAAGLTPSAVPRNDALPDSDLTLLAGDITVLVSCWN
jgi:S1-C subfamily serine protease